MEDFELLLALSRIPIVAFHDPSVLPEHAELKYLGGFACGTLRAEPRLSPMYKSRRPHAEYIMHCGEPDERSMASRRG